MNFLKACMRRRSLPIPDFPMPIVPGGVSDTGITTTTTTKPPVNNPLEKANVTVQEQMLDFAGSANESVFDAYAHQLRDGYSKLGVRVDFTETILFVPLK